MKKIKIITLADAEYLQYLKPFIISASRNFKEASMYVVLVNESISEANKLKILHPDIKVIIENVKFKNNNEKKCYCTNRRVYLFKQLRKITDDMLVWIVADSIIRKNCAPFIEHLCSCELTMRRKKRADKFAAGVIGIDSTDICKKFINYYYNLVIKDSSWMSNQVNLRMAYKEFQGKINFEYLPREYCDVWLSDEGVIWTAKSKTKYDQKFLMEQKKYLDKEKS